MITQQQIRLTKLALALSVALAASPSFAQNTTSAVGGRISNVSGQPAAGAQVQILHTESGSVSNVVTDAEGRYVARGLRVGGPYTITITKDGITQTRNNVFLDLAQTAEVDATLGVQTVTIAGTAQRSEIFSNNNMGAGTAISNTQLQTQASINRNLQDYARADPRVSQTDKERGEISVAGQNSRYNSLTIDGVAINDTFGLEANGSPTARQPISIEAIQSVQVNVANYDVTQKGYTGGNINAVTKSGTNTYKGGLYYVFRNDTMSGDRYNPTDDTYSDAPKSKETTKGIWASGPLIQDKLFIYALAENFESSRSSPAFGPIGSGAGTTVGITQSAITAAQNIAQTTYGTNIGSTEVPAGSMLTSKERMVKFDWNITDEHRANLRYAKTEQNEPFYPGFSATGVGLSSGFYNQGKSIETVVAQLFSDWTPNFSTELRFSTRDYDSIPQNATAMPAISLQFQGALPAGAPAGVPTGNRFLNFGTEYSRQNNVLRTDTKDFYAGANWIVGDHEIKGGVDQTKNKVYNAFLQGVYGQYTFGCIASTSATFYGFGALPNCSTASQATLEAAVLENFRRGRPSFYNVQTPVAGGSLNNAIAQFEVKNTGLFLQDTWTVSEDLTVTYGVRYDRNDVGGRPLANAAVAQAVIAGNPATNVRQRGGFGYDNTRTIDGQDLIQPRVGFNYRFSNAPRPTQLRGGFGLFQGAAATVWMSNPFSNPGVATRFVSCSTTAAVNCPTADGLFSINPNNQPNVPGVTPAANVDILDPSFKQPSIWKANVAFDTELPWYGVVFGAEYLYTKNKDSIYYENLNLGPATATGSDGRQLFWNAGGRDASCFSVANGTVSTRTGCVTSRALSNLSYNNVLLAKGTDKGDANIVTLSLSRPLTKGFGWSVAYSYTDATEVSPLTSSTSSSNYSGRSVFNPNEEVTANSSYLVKNRVSALMNFQKKFFGEYNTRLGIFYEGREGKPYSWTFNNDMNGDNLAGNDLMYIPTAFGSGEVVFYGDTATNKANEQKFWDIVNSNDQLKNAAGGSVKRNGSFAKWTNSFDVRISQEIPGIFERNKGTFSLDILNFGNLLNKKWGRIYEVPFQGNGGTARSFVDYAGIDAQGRYVYAVRPQVESQDLRQAKGESQWAIQATVKYEF
ncbi:TonB-dependent receptor domain-containing protein [Massilia aurea]|uniref:TonB-dependent receptor n=1 Tax=Massilia aurea TaxID=373040 RepID=UPI00216141D0|nr:TonB-dependent receptor [Massilia aurea]MCS0708126.1 carboxypeptidase regulatory-like domain-containing protein [Massilia aurea]